MERSGHDSATSIAVRAMAHYLDRSASGSVTGGATKKAGNWHPIRKPEWFAVWKKFEAGQIQLPVLPGINENLVDVKTTGDLTDIEIESYDDWDDW